jgi:hypothetical protein
MIGPNCECGQATVPSGDHWICGNPGCEGFRQICREMTPEEKGIVAEAKRAVGARQQGSNYQRQAAAAEKSMNHMRERVARDPNVAFTVGDAVFMKPPLDPDAGE